jgi:hypothetical protein
MSILQRIKKVELFYVLLVVYGLWLISLKNRADGGMDDFDVFFKAGERLLNRENIYGEPHYYNLKYFYSVLFANVLAWFQSVDINTVKVFWFILNSSLLFRIFFILKKEVLSHSKYGGILFFILLLMTGKIVLINYTFNQITILILWTMLESYHLFIKGKTFQSIVLLSLGINIKIMPIVLAPYFLWIGKSKFKIAGIGVGALLVFLFLPAVFIGWEYNLFLIQEWGKTLNPASKIHVMQTYEYGLTDLSSMVTKYLSAEEVYKEPQLNVANLSMQNLFLIVNVLRLALLALVVVLALKVKSKILDIDHRLIVVSGFMALIPICFPHQREYSYLCFLPLWSILLHVLFQLKNWKYISIFILLSLVAGLLTWIDFAGERIVNIFMHYRLVTMGMIGTLIFYIYLMVKLAGIKTSKN